MARQRVLLADDSRTVRLLLRGHLEAAGYEVLEVGDGAAAVRATAELRPDVVLLDVEMPGLDGYEAVAALKADPATADVPVVFLTGLSRPEQVARALALGAHDYLRKPPDGVELLARVAAALRVKALQDQLRARNAELERMSRTDHLTGVHNRRHVEEHLLAALSAARRHGRPVAVLLVDVDRFKDVNDSLGHAAGDGVLVEVARRLRAQVRQEDALGRWGGEEFLLVLPQTGRDAAAALAERLRAVVAASPVPYDGGARAVTVSIGGAAVDAPGAPLDATALLALADAQLYRAKAEGRDRVLVARSDAGQPG